MKSFLKSRLKKAKLYHRFRYSRLFRFYKWLTASESIKQHKREVAFYRAFLPPCRMIFDIGANDGHKTEAFVEIAKFVVACEPDAENYEVLKSRFRGRRKRVALENLAVSDSIGKSPYFVHHAGSAFNTLSENWKQILEADNQSRWDERIRFSGEMEVETTTLDYLISRYGVPDFVKIDVEGYELNVLRGLSRRLPCLSFEVLLPDNYVEMKECLARLYSLDNNARFNFSTNEALVLPEFVGLNELETAIATQGKDFAFEIMVKMTK